jgi:hypothetical protein
MISLQPDFISGLQLDFRVIAFLVVIAAASLLLLHDFKTGITITPWVRRHLSVIRASGFALDEEGTWSFSVLAV